MRFCRSKEQASPRDIGLPVESATAAWGPDTPIRCRNRRRTLSIFWTRHASSAHQLVSAVQLCLRGALTEPTRPTEPPLMGFLRPFSVFESPRAFWPSRDGPQPDSHLPALCVFGVRRLGRVALSASIALLAVACAIRSWGFLRETSVWPCPRSLPRRFELPLAGPPPLPPNWPPASCSATSFGNLSQRPSVSWVRIDPRVPLSRLAQNADRSDRRFLDGSLQGVPGPVAASPNEASSLVLRRWCRPPNDRAWRCLPAARTESECPHLSVHLEVLTHRPVCPRTALAAARPPLMRFLRASAP